MNRSIKKALLFVALTFLFSWLLATSFFALGGRLNSLPAIPMMVIYMFIPMTMAIIVQRFIFKEPIKEPLGISFRLNRWFLVAWFLPLIIALATIGVSLLIPEVEYSPEASVMLEMLKPVLTPEELEQARTQMAALPIDFIWLSIPQILIAGATINAVAGFGEEVGWRGFLQGELGYLGFWKSSAIIGLIWGVWHAPIILQGYNYPQHPVAGVFMMTLFTLLFSPIFSYVRLKAKSVIAAAVIHGSLNASGTLPIMVLAGGNDLTVGITGLTGFVVLAVVNAGIFIYNRLWTEESIMER